VGLKDVRRRLPVVEALPTSKTRAYLPREVKERPRPSYAVWEFTLACDQRCRACGPRAGEARHDELDTESSLRLVDELAELGVGEVTLIGGEAYLRDDVLLVIRRIRERGMKATMTTGGLTLTRTRAEAIVEAGIELVSFSIDGLESAHDALRTRGGFRRALEAMRHVKRAGAQVAANTQINRTTMGQLLPLGQVLANEGIVAWQLILTIAHGNAADHPELLLQPYMLLDVYAEIERVLDLCDARGITIWPGNNIGYFGPLEHRLRRHQNADAHYLGCQAGQSGIGIESDGSVKSCPSLGGPANTGGHWGDDSLRTIWEGAPEIRRLGVRTVDDLWGFCRTCYYAEVCMAGCTATTEPLFGKPGNNPFCHHRVLELDAQGLRERIERVRTAPSTPFGFGEFELIQEPKPE
jgi:radical SAM protein with 4Fe4S-binding SPASM domain